MKILYCLKDSSLPGLFYYGIKPYKSTYQSEYDSLNREICLKNDMNWGEVKHLQDLLRKSDIWEDFPLDNITLIDAEFKISDLEQRVDLLYLNSKGCLIPCELKISGTSKDTHGQLIRYISDLCSLSNVDLDYVTNKSKGFAEKFLDSTTKELHIDKTNEFIQKHKLKSIIVSPKKGLIMDTRIKPQLKRAVCHLNSKCGFDIEMIDIKTLVNENWTNSMNEYFFKIIFSKILCT